MFRFVRLSKREHTAGNIASIQQPILSGPLEHGRCELGQTSRQRRPDG